MSAVRFLRRGNQLPPTRWSGEHCIPSSKSGAEPQPPSGFTTFEVLMKASPAAHFSGVQCWVIKQSN